MKNKKKQDKLFGIHVTNENGEYIYKVVIKVGKRTFCHTLPKHITTAETAMLSRDFFYEYFEKTFPKWYDPEKKLNDFLNKPAVLSYELKELIQEIYESKKRIDQISRE